MHRLLASLLLTGCLVVAPSGGLAQSTPGAADPPPTLARGDSLHAAMDPLGALTVFEAILFEDSRNYEVLWRAARECVQLGFLESDPRKRRLRFNQGQTYARLAVRARKTGVAGHYWLAASLGRAALEAPPQEKLAAMDEVVREARTVLTLDPDHPGGHHIVGQWNAEVMRIRGMASVVARRVAAREQDREASWEVAVQELRRATELAPGGLLHRFELARVYVDMGRREEGMTLLQSVLELPAVEPVDSRIQADARLLLDAVSR